MTAKKLEKIPCPPHRYDSTEKRDIRSGVDKSSVIGFMWEQECAVCGEHRSGITQIKGSF